MASDLGIFAVTKEPSRVSESPGDVAMSALPSPVVDGAQPGPARLTLPRADWREIAGLYALLERQMPSPVVRLNRAVAVAMSGDSEAGLTIGLMS